MKAIGIHLKGEYPTADEQRELEMRAQAELVKFRVQRIMAYDPVRAKITIRLDAIEVA